MDNNELELNLEENSPFVKCGKCGHEHAFPTIRFCPEPRINHNSKTHICWYCCKKCEFSEAITECGGLRCNALERHGCEKGVFWLIGGKLICYKTSLRKSDFTFENAWFELDDEIKKENKATDYPHGRIEIKRNKPIISIDKDIFNDFLIKEIAKEFKLDTVVYEIIDTKNHAKERMLTNLKTRRVK